MVDKKPDMEEEERRKIQQHKRASIGLPFGLAGSVRGSEELNGACQCHADYASKRASTSIACWNSWLLLQSMFVLYPLFHELLERLFVCVVVTFFCVCVCVCGCDFWE